MVLARNNEEDHCESSFRYFNRHPVAVYDWLGHHGSHGRGELLVIFDFIRAGHVQHHRLVAARPLTDPQFLGNQWKVSETSCLQLLAAANFKREPKKVITTRVGQ